MAPTSRPERILTVDAGGGLEPIDRRQAEGTRRHRAGEATAEARPT